MPKNISWRAFVKKFQHLGFDGPYSGGRHLFMCKNELKVPIPNKHKGDISIGLVNRILRECDISKEEWDTI